MSCECLGSGFVWKWEGVDKERCEVVYLCLCPQGEYRAQKYTKYTFVNGKAARAAVSYAPPKSAVTPIGSMPIVKHVEDGFFDEREPHEG